MWILRLIRRWLVGRRRTADAASATIFDDPWAEQAIRDFEEEMTR